MNMKFDKCRSFGYRKDAVCCGNREKCPDMRRTHRMMAAALAAVLMCSSMPAFPSYAAAGPAGDKVDSGYDAETLARLQDNVLEYDEIPDLVHEYNTVITDIWDDLDETRQDLIKNAEELDSQKRKMKNLKDTAKDDMKAAMAQDPTSKESLGLAGMYGNYAMQEAILDAVGGGIKSTAQASLVSRTTLSSLQKAENQFVKIGQQLMIAYDSLTKQKNTLMKLEELYGEQYRISQSQLALGLAAEKDVLAARANQMSAKSTVLSIENGLLQLKPTLCTMTGWPADGNPEVAAIPSVDVSRIDDMNLEEDTRKAIGNNTTLISQRTSEKGKTSAGVEARLGVIDEGDQRMTIEMERLYNDVYSKKTAYDAAWDGYQSAQKDKDKYDRMYEMGMLSPTDHLGTEIAYYQKKAAWETADSSLLLALETYHWAVMGLADVPE
ncbi:MAG: TolC family protein [Brotaphodocola sp.]